MKQKKQKNQKVVRLNLNENPFPPSSKVKRVLIKELDNIGRYPDSSCSLLRELYARDQHVDPEQLFFGNGADEIINCCTQIFLTEKDEVLIAGLSFMTCNMPRYLRCENVIEIPPKNLKYDLNSLYKAITKKTKVIFIANPSNPLSTYISKKKLDDFLAKVDPGILVVIDATYEEFVTAKDFPCALSCLAKYPNILVIKSFSKSYGLAGLRIGVAISSKHYIQKLLDHKLTFNVNRLAQVAAVAALSDKPAIHRNIQKIMNEKMYLYSKLAELGVSYVNSETNFILVTTSLPSCELASLLAEKGVLVNSLNCYDLDSYIRVTIGTHHENGIFLRELKEIVNNKYRSTKIKLKKFVSKINMLE